MHDKVNMSKEVKQKKKKSAAGGRGALWSGSDKVTQIGRKAHVRSLHDHRTPLPRFLHLGVGPLQWVHFSSVRQEYSLTAELASAGEAHTAPVGGGKLRRKAKLRDVAPRLVTVPLPP